MKALIVVLLLFAISPLISQEPVKEEMSVDWWVVPLFAVDKSGNPVKDLDKNDVKLYLDDKLVDDFTLYSREYNAGHVVKQDAKPLMEKGKMIFLLFDLVLSDPTGIARAKSVARDIVASAAKDNRFVLFTIEPMSGLKYLTGPVADKNKVLNIIENQVKQIPNKRYLNMEDVVLNMVGGPKGKGGFTEARYSPEEQLFFMQTSAKSMKMKSNSFFRSFALFYYNINSLKDHKFIYLFSEGVSKFQQAMEKGNIYRTYLNEVAQYLGRCGAVLFVVNPATGLDTMGNSLVSGKNSLEYLAKISGGKYFQGIGRNVARGIENFHRAYYEIAFAATGEGKIHRIRMEAGKPGFKIHTLGMLEKQKSYEQMNDIEKEVMVLNLAERNSLYNSPLKVKAIEVIKSSKSEGEILYKVKVPADFLNKKTHLYTLTPNKEGSMQIEKEVLFLKKKKSKLVIPYTGEGEEPRFLLVAGPLGKALIKAPGYYDPLVTGKKNGKKSYLSDDPAYQEKLEGYLQGAAVYCQKLRKQAFHFYCKEKIAETYTFYSSHGQQLSDISYYENRATTNDMRKRINQRNYSHKHVTKYLFDYQLIQDKGEIKEQRKMLSGPQIKGKDPNVQYLVVSFLTERAIFGPITLLANERQGLFIFKLIKYEKIKDKRFAVVEAMPKDQKTTFAYGKVWIDTGDFSVVKMEIDPRSMRGIKDLLQRARHYQTRLYLKCIIEFNKLREGLRFPTLITMSELYKGGPVITKQKGSRGWERSKTSVEYKDYRFFEVGVSVESEGIK